MTDVRPFRALRYDPRKVELARVLAPVYDVVAPEDRALYWDRDPYNALRLELTKRVEDEAETDYAESAARLAAWRAAGVLVRDAAPALYVLRQSFEAPDGRTLARTGFLAALRLEDYARRIVRPHERTLAGPKADRLKSLRATRANLSSVFVLYEDRTGELEPTLEAALASAEAVEASDDAGIHHRLAPLRARASVDVVRQFLAPRPVVIADGHHRYETALTFRDERRATGERDPEAPHERILAYFANAFAPGSLLLPIHRLVRKGPPPTEEVWRRLEKQGSRRWPGPSRDVPRSEPQASEAAARGTRLGEPPSHVPRSEPQASEAAVWERREVALGSAEAVPAALEQHLAPLADRHAFAADDGGGRLRIFSRPADGELSVRVLHRDVLGALLGLDDAAVRDGAVDFPKSALQTARDVRSGRGALALYLNALRPDDVFRVTEAGETLPQKSTFFHPKLPTGLLFRTLEPE